MSFIWASSTSTYSDPLYSTGNQRPTLDLQFARGKSLNDYASGQNLVTFTRDSIGTYVDENGLIQTATANTPRFDHDPATGESLGLLVEESRTNYLGMFASPNYNNNNSATYSAYSDSRFGADQNAHSWTYASAQTNVELGWFNPGSISTTGNGVQYTVSGWIKANQAYTLRGNLIDERRQGINFDFDLTTEWQYFSLSTPAGINDDGSGTVYFRWIRGNISIPAGLQLDFAAINLERGGFPTSYIPTSGSAVTRAADVAEITGTNFSSWYNQSEGTMFADKTFNINNGHTYYFADSSLTTNRIRLQAITHSSNNISDGSFFQFAVDGNKTALGLQTDNVSVNGFAPDTSFTMPSSLDRLFIGRHATVSSYLNGHIKRLTYYPVRLPDATLQTITS
jgi:hypothetical protein